MLHDLCNPLTIKIMALGRPLYEAERIAAVIVIWVVLICAMTGCRIGVAGMPDREPDEMSGSGGSTPARGTGPVSICGIFPAGTGTVADTSRALLHTQ
ncbi:MAG: hypothetical protein CVV32_00385 [Methanomicrobiales archaeon HGW-Methanomicrobiales-3]|jgi:hypothetical protein|nr:MAG: hypothetical protein CVV32_00385 [Methanomicrobiales archaeon HGW-Methanomicrobiales-3]